MTSKSSGGGLLPYPLPLSHSPTHHHQSQSIHQSNVRSTSTSSSSSPHRSSSYSLRQQQATTDYTKKKMLIGGSPPKQVYANNNSSTSRSRSQSNPRSNHHHHKKQSQQHAKSSSSSSTIESSSSSTLSSSSPVSTLSSSSSLLKLDNHSKKNYNNSNSNHNNRPRRSESVPLRRSASVDHLLPPNSPHQTFNHKSHSRKNKQPPPPTMSQVHVRRSQSVTRTRSGYHNRHQDYAHDHNIQFLPHALSSDNVSHEWREEDEEEEEEFSENEFSTHSAPPAHHKNAVAYHLDDYPPSKSSNHHTNNLHHHHHHHYPQPPQQQPQARVDKRDPSPFAVKRADFSREISLDGSENSEKQYVRSTKRIVEELSRAQGATRRVAAVTSACEAFDHHDEARHNIELQNGAVQVLAKMLEQSSTKDDELRMICAALEMVFRGSPLAIQDAYQRTSTNFLSSLLRMLDRCEERTVKHADISILNISKMICYLSKCPDLRVSLCRHPDMEHFLGRVASPVLNPDCRALRLRILANLAAADKNRTLLYDNLAIVDGILRIAHMDTFDLARQNAALTLQELASSSRNHVGMANNDQLLGILVKMALVEKSLVARDSVISTLQTLAYTKQNRTRLVTYKEGVVLEALKRTLSVDPDERIRRRAAGTLTNLACEETAEAMGNHKGLLEALAIISTKDYNVDVQTRAALALTKIGNCISVQMKCFRALLDALVVASLSKSSNGVTAVLRLKAREPENRQVMAHHSGVMDTICDVCVSSSGVDRENAVRSLMHLVNDGQNRKTLCNKVILHALVVTAALEADSDETKSTATADEDKKKKDATNISHDGTLNSDQSAQVLDARDSAIRALERLATEASNRPTMARHPGLLQVVAKAVEREVKLEDAKVESEHGYLAKPLLMTLLLAM